MTLKNPNLLLRQAEVEPTDAVLEQTLGANLFSVYHEIIDLTAEYDLNYEWRFYPDGKAWLCKVVHKAKTIFWLSVWDDAIKLGFYFSEKTQHGVCELAIAPNIIEDFKNAKPIGKLIPLTFVAQNKSQLTDLRQIIQYKKSLK